MSQEQWIDIGLYGSMVLILVAIVAAIGMNIVNAISNPKTLVKGAAGIGLLAIVFLIGYSMAPTEFGASTAKALEASKIDPTSDGAGNIYKLVGGAMTTTLILVVIAVVGLIYSSVSRIIR
ncbi:hypothetical protein [Roseivirga misakiensis]|uniref:Uncharacterized protein n=1 Tax=Roseivirga misakiensis TaxID=1563681 RepID=A0A1E5T1U4_9BACT|nr:hypothetical protein [Roseivirga misakiensis]OEK05331.1 hypothetical protein BFP71_18225 [Roseivirga misakiensis]